MSDPRNAAPARKARTGLEAVGLAAAALILLWLLVLDPLLHPHDGALTDYAAAGAALREDIRDQEEISYVSFNTTEYNPILGAAPIYGKIMQEAMAHDGSPAGGDHLAIGTALTEVEYTQVPQKDGSDNLNMKLHLLYYTTPEQERELADKAAAILSELKLAGASEYEKALAIYGYICSHVVYDYEHLEDEDYHLKSTAYAAALHGTAVCSGIADLFYYLANSAGLDARIKTNDSHAWNYVRVDGRYYYADATWDLGRSPEEYAYFLKGALDFTDHQGTLTVLPDTCVELLTNGFLEYDIAATAYGTN